jgi:hypothetical protein
VIPKKTGTVSPIERKGSMGAISKHLSAIGLSVFLNSDIKIKRETAFAKEIPRNGIRNFYLTAVSCIWHRSVLG